MHCFIFLLTSPNLFFIFYFYIYIKILNKNQIHSNKNSTIIDRIQRYLAKFVNISYLLPLVIFYCLLFFETCSSLSFF